MIQETSTTCEKPWKNSMSEKMFFGEREEQGHEYIKLCTEAVERKLFVLGVSLGGCWVGKGDGIWGRWKSCQ